MKQLSLYLALIVVLAALYLADAIRRDRKEVSSAPANGRLHSKLQKTEQGSSRLLIPNNIFDSLENINSTEQVTAEEQLAVLAAPGIDSDTTRSLSSLHLASTNSTGQQRKRFLHADDNWGKHEGKVFFLFLAVNSIDRPDLWARFFSHAPPNHYRAFIHCKYYTSCMLEKTLRRLAGATLVDTVPSSYCHDLVSPMVQLLRSAILESASANDKFVFLSESTLPVKPFSHIYSTLMSNQASDFCVFPAKHWLRLRFDDPGKSGDSPFHSLLVKHGQWVVLNQEHADTLTNSWTTVVNGVNHTHWSIPVWSDETGGVLTPGKLPRSVKDRVCTDEWAIFGTIYGTIVDYGQQNIHLKDFGGRDATLQLRGRESGTQGMCRTLTYWDVSEAPVGTDAVLHQLLKDGESRLSCYPKCQGFHPAEFMALSDAGVLALRRSSFIFARKFRKDSISMQQFMNFILSD